MPVKSPHPAVTTPEPWQHSENANAHIERVFAIAEGRASSSSDDETATSWHRSATVHGVDPESKEAPRILTNSELNELREPLARLIVEARDELDHLYAIVQQADYTVLLCSDQGIAVDHRGNVAEADQFKYWGTWLGGVWSEDVEGTNGIGTCITERRPVTIHRSQHFRARHISLSCSGAPIFGSDGKLTAVLDISSIDPRLSEASHALTGALTQVSARAIEERCFRESFRRNWIVAVGAAGEGSDMLFAIDRDHKIVGADRHARAMLTRRGLRLDVGVGLWTLFEPNPGLFKGTEQGDIAALVTLVGGRDQWPVVLTPPEATWLRTGMSRVHSRPRLHRMGEFRIWTPSQSHGGLPPGSLRRVKEYVDANLDKRIDVATLARAAGFSTFHFARAFKQSEGITPHRYVLERRVERARNLLLTSDLSLSEIARTSGFSDQGHLARHIRQRLGLSPSALRRSMR